MEVAKKEESWISEDSTHPGPEPWEVGAARSMALQQASDCHGNVHNRRHHGFGADQVLDVFEAKFAAVDAGDGAFGLEDVAEAIQLGTRIEVELARRTKSWCQKIEMASGTAGPYDLVREG